MSEHRIETFDDFAKVPDDKMDECLADFREWLEWRLEFLAADDAVKHIINMSPVFTWIDDGKRGVSGVRISTERTYTEEQWRRAMVEVYSRRNVIVDPKEVDGVLAFMRSDS